jgi:hypothetical protein
VKSSHLARTSSWSRVARLCLPTASGSQFGVAAPINSSEPGLRAEIARAVDP